MIQAIILCPNAKTVFAGKKTNQCTVFFFRSIKDDFYFGSIKERINTQISEEKLKESDRF